MSPVQTQFATTPGAGYPGSLSRAEEPHIYIHPAVFHLPAAGRKARPGDPVYYDAAENKFALPHNAATLLQTLGIVSYDLGTIQSLLAAIPAGSNSPAFIEYDDDAILKVGVMGTFYAIAGEALEFGDLVVWDVASFKWDKLTKPAAFADLHSYPVVVASRAPVAVDGLVELRFGSGRVI